MEKAWGVKTTLLHPLDVYSLTDRLEMPGVSMLLVLAKIIYILSNYT